MLDMEMRTKHRLFLGGIVFALTCVAWAGLSLRDDDSTLSVLARYVTRSVKQKMGWSDDLVGVLNRMTKYEKKGRYDEAIGAGAAWAEKHPESFESGWIYQDISVLYLRKADLNRGRTDEFAKQAVLYRDKALRDANDSPYFLRQLVAISESIGDISEAQRCVQYGNSMKLLDRISSLAGEDNDKLAREFKPDPAERKKLESLADWNSSTIKRMRTKMSTAGCQ